VMTRLASGPSFREYQRWAGSHLISRSGRARESTIIAGSLLSPES